MLSAIGPERAVHRSAADILCALAKFNKTKGSINGWNIKCSTDFV